MQLPSPPGLDVNRDYAGGYGVAVRVPRKTFGHDGVSQELMPNVILSHATGVLTEDGHCVEFCDAQVERLDERGVLNRIGSASPDMLVTCLNLPSLEGDRYLLQLARGAYPSMPVVASGTVCRTLPEQALAGGLVDLAPVTNEETVIQLAARCVAEGRSASTAPGGLVWRNGATVSSGPAPAPRPLDDLPFPAYDLMPMKHYRVNLLGRIMQYAPIYTTRGCPYPCSYCPYPVGLGKAVRFRTVPKVVEEIALVHDFGAESLIFRDQTFTLNRKYAGAICEAMAEMDFGMEWICETRVDIVDRDMLEKMRAAGCRGINFGMETGDPDLLKRVGKPGATIDDLKKAVKLTRKSGLFTQVHVIVGLPGETWQTIQTTLRTLYALKVDNADFNIITPYPGTPLFEYAEAHGLIVSKLWSDYTSVDPTMRTETMTIAELKQAQQYLDWAFRRKAPFATRWVRRYRAFRFSGNKLHRVGKFALRALTTPLTAPVTLETSIPDSEVK